MELDQKTGKLLALFLSTHLIAGVLGLITAVLLGALAGVAAFAASVIILPLLLQYLYLSKNNE